NGSLAAMGGFAAVESLPKVIGSVAPAPANTFAAAPMIKKSLKWGMVKEDLSILDKFKLLKDLGFDGVELDTPNNLDMKEVLNARDKTGLELPGTVNSFHWKSPLSDPDPKVRAACVE